MEQTQEKCFNALTTEISNWWGAQDRLVHQVNDIFKVSWGELWYQFKVIEYKPVDKLVWECIDANQIIHGLEGVQKEWVGTEVHWRLSPNGKNQTKIDFVHKGLVPEFICYETCERGWNHYLSGELKKYLS